MDIEKALLKEHSKSQTIKIVKYIGNDLKKFDQLMNVFLKEENILSQRASWVVSYCVEANPELINLYLKKIIPNLKKKVHDAVKRNTLRLLQNIEIPANLQGELADVCFNFLSSGNEPVAIKVFAMTVLYNLSKKEPELKRELKIIIEDRMPFEKAAFASRGRKTLKLLAK